MNWGWRFCRPLPYHLAMPPLRLKFDVFLYYTKSQLFQHICQKFREAKLSRRESRFFFHTLKTLLGGYFRTKSIARNTIHDTRFSPTRRPNHRHSLVCRGRSNLERPLNRPHSPKGSRSPATDPAAARLTFADRRLVPRRNTRILPAPRLPHRPPRNSRPLDTWKSRQHPCHGRNLKSAAHFPRKIMDAGKLAVSLAFECGSGMRRRATFPRKLAVARLSTATNERSTCYDCFAPSCFADRL